MAESEFLSNRGFRTVTFKHNPTPENVHLFVVIIFTLQIIVTYTTEQLQAEQRGCAFEEVVNIYSSPINHGEEGVWRRNSVSSLFQR